MSSYLVESADVQHISVVTQAQYDALTPPVATTLYIITESAATPPATWLDTATADSATGIWLLDETSGTVADDAVGTADGTYVNTPTLGVAGLVAGSSGAVSTAAASQEDITLPVALGDVCTVEWWYRWTAGTVPVRDSTPTGGWVFGYDSGGTWTIRIAGTNTATSKTTVQMRDGNTHHVVVAKNGATAEVYVDGVLVASPTGLGAASSVSPLHFGRGGPTTSYADATFDCIAVYATALSGERALAHYTAGQA